MALSKTTQDHDEIRQWAEKRGGRPADVESTEHGSEAGILRLEFPEAPNANDANLKEIDWEPFFEKFDKSGLEMVYQEVTSEGAESNFYKFVTAEPKPLPKRKAPAKRAAKSSGAKTAAKKAAPAAAAKKSAAKKSASKKAPANKSAAKKTAKKAAKKAPAKRIAVKKPAVKSAKKTVMKKVAAKKSATVKKSVSKSARKAARR